jgi:dipeptidyl aminopeptidase/acylaminoacyl peptidase
MLPKRTALFVTAAFTIVDAVKHLAPVDDHRLALFGRTYGCLVIMWAATRTDRFRAIWSGAGVSDRGPYHSETVTPAWVDR